MADQNTSLASYIEPYVAEEVESAVSEAVEFHVNQYLAKNNADFEDYDSESEATERLRDLVEEAIDEAVEDLVDESLPSAMDQVLSKQADGYTAALKARDLVQLIRDDLLNRIEQALTQTLSDEEADA